jgi:hypothetical protein
MELREVGKGKEKGHQKYIKLNICEGRGYNYVLKAV